jgi:hypothetical protein
VIKNEIVMLKSFEAGYYRQELTKKPTGKGGDDKKKLQIKSY